MALQSSHPVWCYVSMELMETPERAGIRAVEAKLLMQQLVVGKKGT